MNTYWNDIFEYITSMESMYRVPIQLNDSWEWSMRDHIETSDLYAHSQIKGAKDDFTPIKNITRPILNLQHRTEDLEVKDVQIYVNDPEKFHLSFLVKKYHDEVFVKKHNIDQFLDELNISRIDYGAGLSKKLDKPCPEVVPLQSIAFCDQTDILSGPIGLKHFYSPDQLLEMGKKGWGRPENGATASVEDVIMLSRTEKKEDNSRRTNQTPGKYIEVYEVHGNLPKVFANPNDTSGEYETRMFICCFYQRKDKPERQGLVLYTAPEKELPFKVVKRDNIYGRALGFGGAEELFEPQVWVNYSMVRMQRMLEAASTTLLKTTDPSVATNNDIRDMENLDIIELAPNTDIGQMDTFPRNTQVFDKAVEQWEAHAQQMAAANDAIMGKSPASGTPFALQELVVSTNEGLHEYRRQQYAKHVEEIYRDWIIPHIQKEITRGSRFLSELSLDEVQKVVEDMVDHEAKDKIKMMMLSGEVPTEEEINLFKDMKREELKKKGNKYFIEILKDEFSGSELGVQVSVAGKSKNLAQMTEKLVNIFRFVFANPQGFAAAMQMPGLGKAFNEILEFSGLSPIDFSAVDKITQSLQLQGPETGQSPAQLQPMASPVASPVAAPVAA